jgi:flavorubredoxin/flavin reductase (DIM6/NTAB) family NADH-FMN oxidoreductase RutF
LPEPSHLRFTPPPFLSFFLKDADPELASLLERCPPTAVSRSTELSLSNGTPLRFIPVPTPRWPELTAVYLPEDKALITSEWFAAHVAPTSVAGTNEGGKGGEPSTAFDEGGWDRYGDDWRHYFDCMLAPAARQSAAGLARLRINATPAPAESGALAAVLAPLKTFASLVESLTLGADDGTPEPTAAGLLLPLHGPIVRSSLSELVGRYGDWTAAQVKAAGDASVAVLYASAYGNTAALAQAISRGITKAGVGVETLNLEIVGVAEVEKALESAAGFIIGSPTLGGHMPTQVQTALGAILRTAEAKGLPCGVFGSFGWSGEAVDMMESRLKDAGFKFAFDSIRCKFAPTEGTLQVCEESGTDLAQVIRKRARQRERSVAQKLAAADVADGPAVAMGRVIGSLCAVTARDGDAAGAMLASWVSQASFDPPGLTVAVKKDRAVEALLPEGACFVLNVLADGKDKPVMKQLLKPFKPGEDRFAGLEVKDSEATGAPILAQAASYLECRVGQRMEAGDHWIVYALVEGGGVLDEGADSAVHFRKVGTTY